MRIQLVRLLSILSADDALDRVHYLVACEQRGRESQRPATRTQVLAECGAPRIFEATALILEAYGTRWTAQSDSRSESNEWSAIDPAHACSPYKGQARETALTCATARGQSCAITAFGRLPHHWSAPAQSP